MTSIHPVENVNTQSSRRRVFHLGRAKTSHVIAQSGDRRHDTMRSSSFTACLITFALATSRAAASRPFYEAPLLAPLVAPKTLAAWQPREWSVSVANDPENVVARDDDEDEFNDEYNDVSDDASSSSDVLETTDHHPSSWRRFFAAARDVDVRPIAATVAARREGWTGASVSTTAQFSIDG